MSPNSGSVALVVAVASAGIAAVIAGTRPAWARIVVRIAALGLALSTIFLLTSIMTQDYELAYVADHVRPEMGWPMRAASLWAGSEGSMLLFAAIVAAAIALAAPSEPIEQAAAAGAIAVLAATSLWAANPFEELAIAPLEGIGPPPVLDHPAMVFHPPLLYIGLAASLAPALLHRTQPQIAQLVAGAAASIMTVALALGAVWAYVELGWGGWWAWDPVENVALVCWLILVATIHARKSQRPVLYATLWPAVFAGAALTRTSLRTSVHAFADASSIGWFLWPLTGVSVIAAAAIAIDRARRARPQRADLIRRPQRLLAAASTTTLVTCAVIVALGTYRPMIPGEATEGWFYSRMLFAPLVVALPLMGLRLGASGTVSQVSVRLGLGGAAAGVAVGLLAGARASHQLVLAASLGAGLVLSMGRQRPARAVAHCGFLLLVAGIIGSTASTTVSRTIDPGETITVEGHPIEVVGVYSVEEPRLAVEAQISVDGRSATTSIVQHLDRGVRTTETATLRGVLDDVQVILRSADDTGAVAVIVNVQPLVSLVWCGSVLMAGSLAFVAFDGAGKRRRVREHPTSGPQIQHSVADRSR